MPRAEVVLRRGLVLPLAALLVAACGGVMPSGAPRQTASVPADASVPAEDPRTAGWRADLDRLITARERFHREPWHGIDRDEYASAVAEVAASVPSLGDDELLVEITRLAAMPTWAGRDGHGGIYPWAEGDRQTHLYPLRLYHFSDGLFVTDAVGAHDDLVGAEVVHVNGHPVADVLAAVEPLVPRDNHQQVLTHGPLLLLTTEVLHGLGLIEDAEASVTFGFSRDGSAFEAQLTPVPRDTWFAGADGHLVMSPPARPEGPAWLRQPHVATWWELQPDSATAYVQYNVTQSPGDVPQQVGEAIAAGTVSRVVVDVRHNGGGNNGTYGGLLELLGSPPLAAPGRAYVIMGRATFSAAGNFVAEADQLAHVILVGEDSGGSPNQYGDSVTLDLDQSGLVLRVAPEFVLRTDPADLRVTVEPDIRAPLSSADYFGDRDPAMEAILADS